MALGRRTNTNDQLDGQVCGVAFGGRGEGGDGPFACWAVLSLHAAGNAQESHRFCGHISGFLASPSD